MAGRLLAGTGDWRVGLLFGGVLLCSSGWSETVLAAKPGETEATFESLRQQGIHYYDKKKLIPAKDALEAAALKPAAAKDYKTHMYLAKVYYDLLILEKAFPEANKARELAGNDDQQRNAENFLEALNAAFGGVTFQKDPEQKTELKDTFIHLKDQGGLINMKKKEVFTKIQERFKTTKVTLPTTLYLPFGKYSANGAPFEIKQGEMAQANLFMYSSDPDAGLAWYWWAGGAAVLVGGAAAVTAILLAGGDEERQQFLFGSVAFNPAASGEE